MTIRQATAGDWPQIWSIFDATVRAGETYAYPSDLTPDSARDLWMEPPPGQTVVLEGGGSILGTAKMGPNRAGPGSHIATASFMVAAEVRGRGVGTALCRFALDWAKERGWSKTTHQTGETVRLVMYPSRREARGGLIKRIERPAGHLIVSRPWLDGR